MYICSRVCIECMGLSVMLLGLGVCMYVRMHVYSSAWIYIAMCMSIIVLCAEIFIHCEVYLYASPISPIVPTIGDVEVLALTLDTVQVDVAVSDDGGQPVLKYTVSRAERYFTWCM